jgi:Ca2+-transporting ATPase
MGIAGTEVAKEASSIILMDDNFSSIVKSVMWGRVINDSVKKFLQFQLTVNISAVVVAFFSSVYSENNISVLSAVQLLWINLIMDTFAALALATDPPTESLLNRYPDPKKAPLLSMSIWKMVLGQSIYQIAVSILLFLHGIQIFQLDPNSEHDKKLMNTFIFNTFAFMQLFNQCKYWNLILVNSRSISNNINIFEGILNNRMFFLISFVVVSGQILIILIGGEAFKTTPLTGPMWGVSILFGMLSLVIGVILRLLPDIPRPRIFGPIPEPYRPVTKERLLFDYAISAIRTQQSVFKILRGRAGNDNISLSSSKEENVPSIKTSYVGKKSVSSAFKKESQI